MVADVIGRDRAVMLARAIDPVPSGQRFVCVPARPRAEHLIAQAVGYQAMADLCAALGGMQISLGDPDRFARRERMMDLLRSGITPSRVARMVGMSRSHVSRVSTRMRYA